MVKIEAPSEQKASGPEIHPLQTRLILKKSFTEAAQKLKKQPTYENYEEASQALEKYALSLNVISYDPKAKGELKEIEKLQKNFYGQELYFFHSRILFLCIKKIADKPNRENVRSLHGVLCLLLRDCREYQGMVSEETRPDFIDLRIQILEQLKKNHAILGEQKDVRGYEKVISETQGELARLREEMEARKELRKNQ